MKEAYRNEGLAAVTYVNTTLGIKSTNRKDDNPAPEGMKNLTEARMKYADEKGTKKSQHVEKWREELKIKDLNDSVVMKSIREKNQLFQTDKTLSESQKATLKSEIQTLTQSHKLLQEECSKLKSDIKAAGTFTPKEDAKILAKAATETRFGNCEEKSAVAYFFLRSRNVRPIELMASGQNRNLEGDSHQFVVIGRKKTENPDDPDTWSEAAVCDPWDNSVYEPSDLPSKLESFGYIDTINPLLREDS